MIGENPQEEESVPQGYIPPQQPLPPQQPPRQYYPTSRPMDQIASSNMVILLAILFGYFMLFIGGAIMIFGSGDAIKAGIVLVELGLAAMDSMILFAMIMRKDIDRWVRVAVIVFVIVMTIYLMVLLMGGATIGLATQQSGGPGGY